MPEVIDLVIIVTFLGVWAIVATDLIGRHGREAKRLATKSHID